MASSISQPSGIFSLKSINGSQLSRSFVKAKPRCLKIHKISGSMFDPKDSSAMNDDDDSQNVSDPVKVAFTKAMKYRKSKQSNPTGTTPNPVPEAKKKGSFENPVSKSSESVNDNSNPVVESDGSGTISDPVKLALEKAKNYQKNKGSTIVSNGSESKKQTISGNSEDSEEKIGKKDEMNISSINFVGLNFSDKKSGRGLPAGLVPIDDPFQDKDLPDVELIVGDRSKFGESTSSKPGSSEDDSADYKPKISTWGVFPRPGNISKTFGGGRVIRPGEILETAEDKAAKDSRTKQLLASYKSKTGLTIDPKKKAECEKALKDGDHLMDLGKLQQALPFYEKVMNELTFQAELHGLAALQWSICQDSLSRSNEARVMYEKLQSHPNVQVRKKARQLMFGFQAMEMLKVRTTRSSVKTTEYQKYFEAFVEKDKSNFSPVEEGSESAFKQALPYILLLCSPIFIVLYIALGKMR